jgi:hypothetical protein
MIDQDDESQHVLKLTMVPLSLTNYEEHKLTITSELGVRKNVLGVTENDLKVCQKVVLYLPKACWRMRGFSRGDTADQQKILQLV